MMQGERAALIRELAWVTIREAQRRKADAVLRIDLQFFARHDRFEKIRIELRQVHTRPVKLLLIGKK